MENWELCLQELAANLELSKYFSFFSDFSVVFGFVIYYVRLFLKDPQNQFVHLYIYLYFFLVFLMSCSRQQSADSKAIRVFLKFLDCAQ